jgi:uncharacterized protein
MEMIDVDDIKKELLDYIKENIFPLYSKFLTHGKDHIDMVIEQSLIIAKDFDVDINMVYTIACYHDIGLLNGRENHEKESGKFLFEDLNLRDFFSEEQVIIMKEAVEDHRGSRKIEPRNIYGNIVSDADRDSSVEVLAKRQLATSIKNYPNLKTFDEHFERCYQYISSRANENFDFNLWTENKVMRDRLNKFKEEFKDKENTRNIYYKEYKYIEDNDLFYKIQNEYYD